MADFKCDNMPHIVLSLAIMVEMTFLNQKLTFKNIYIFTVVKKKCDNLPQSPLLQLIFLHLLLLKHFLTVMWTLFFPQSSISFLIKFLITTKKHKLLFWWCILWVLNQIVIAHPPNTRLLRFLFWPFPCRLLKTFLTAKKIHQHPRNLPMTFRQNQISHERAVMRQRHLVLTTSRCLMSAREMEKTLI